MGDPPAPPVPRALTFVLGLAAVCASQRPPPGARWRGVDAWLAALLELLQLDRELLPQDVDPRDVAPLAAQRDQWSDEEKEGLARALVRAALAPHAPSHQYALTYSEGEAKAAALAEKDHGPSQEKKEIKGKKSEEQRVEYTPSARACAHATLSILGLDAAYLLPRAEVHVSATLAAALDGDASSSGVDNAKEKQKNGWGGSLGRTIATGAGVIVGGVLIGVTGGLAAPAIAVLMAEVGLGVISVGAAPIVLGTLFGLTGGGLAGWRVSERWRGVDEFGFIEVGAGTQPTDDEVADLKQREQDTLFDADLEHDEAEADASKTAAEREVERNMKELALQDAERRSNAYPGAEAAAQREIQRNLKELEAFEYSDVAQGGRRQSAVPTDEETAELIDPDASAAGRRQAEDNRKAAQNRLINLSHRAGTDHVSPPETPPLQGSKTESPGKPTRPSLTATVVVPGLLTVSRTEAMAAWRAACSPKTLLPYRARMTEKDKDECDDTGAPTGVKDGRDVYLLRFETQTMLDTGRDIESWVLSKLRDVAKVEVIKRTVLSAYYAAIALPLSVYKLSTMALDNSWMLAQGRAVKAGRLLGEVLAERVQGERPVVLIGTSVGALTVMHALLHLASVDVASTIVESAYLISLPSAPTAAEWAAARRVTARRLVNGYSGSDFVLAGVVRLHEVVSHGVTGNNGVCVAGIGPVQQPGVEDIDLSEVLKGHGEINTGISEILDVIRVDG